MQNYTSGADDGVAPDRDPCSDGYCGAEPYVVADGYRMSSFPSLASSPVVVDGVEGRHQLSAGSDASVISDCDYGVVHEERVGVDERSSSEPNVVPVAALKPRHDDGVVTESAEHIHQDSDVSCVVDGVHSIERVELLGAASTSSSKFVVVEVPLAAFQCADRFRHVHILAPR